MGADDPAGPLGATARPESPPLRPLAPGSAAAVHQGISVRVGFGFGKVLVVSGPDGRPGLGWSANLGHQGKAERRWGHRHR